MLSQDLTPFPSISKQPTGWFMSVQIEIVVVGPIHSSTSSVGIDVGIAKFATLSNGQIIDPINMLRAFEKKLVKLQPRKRSFQITG